ncbi:PAS domain-containing protein [Xanthomonas campestris]|uniref:PAS domain-containing protein n=1 Tax=Xanthomonas campestris TaxID=339 RepID=UPI000E325B73|nr:PAS domain-containing protein [Xanthomonas campestris]RFF45149.1 PAS domain S-box protein [Xanthomonas campestris]
MHDAVDRPPFDGKTHRARLPYFRQWSTPTTSDAMPVDPSGESFSFLAGGGEMGARMRAHDWSGSALGLPSQWPQSLRSALSICLNSPVLATVLWGPDLVMLYNDAYIPSMADRHPWALGQPVSEVWGASWEQVAPPFRRCLQTGEGFEQRHVELPMVRRGVPETTYWNFSAAPIRGEDGSIVGLFNQGIEITETVRADRLRAAEAERQRRLFEQAPGFTAILHGPEHVFAFVNAAYLRLVGGRDMLGMSVRAGLPELEGQGFYELLDSVYSTGERFVASAVSIQLQRTGTGAEQRFVDFVYEPVKDDAGRVTGIFVQGFDTTDAQQAQQALRESEKRYRMLFENIDAGFCIAEVKFDAQGQAIDHRMLAVNPAFERHTGLTDVVGKWSSQLLPGIEQEWHEAYGRVARSGEPLRFEREAARLGRWYDAHLFPAGTHDNHVAMLIVDITQRRRVEQQLRDLNETLEQRVVEALAERRLFADFVDSTDAAVLACDLDFTILALNTASTEALRLAYGVSAHVGDNLLGLLDGLPEHRAQVARHWGRALSGDEFLVLEEFGDPARALRHYEVRFSQLRDRHGGRVGAFQVAQDVTDRVQTEASLEVAREALRQSQKMEAVGQLTGGLAHDFNNLLTGISGSLELMQTRMGQGRFDDVERYIAVAQKAAGRAAALTHRLLAFSRRQTLAPKPTDVNALIAGMEDLIRRTVGPSIELTTVAEQALWPALVDPSQLENALLNLCLNARDAMPDGGRITIETSNSWLNHSATQQNEVPDGEYLSLCVSDTGTGMPEDVIARVFEPFFTTKPIGEGTGLGLSMIYGFAQQSGGQVRVSSTVGEGTTVCIHLPRHLGDATGDAQARTLPAMPRSQQGETVLVVDDEPSVRMLVADILEELGYTALQAVDGASGLSVLQSDVRIDLLITDVGLPGGMNGRQMADAARIARPRLSVLFITGYAETAVLGDGQLAPGMAVLTKPFGIDAMAARIREMIR